MDINSISLTGRLGQDPEIRYSGEKPVCNLSVAVTLPKNETLWVRVAVWGKSAEACAEYLSKGSRVGIKGRVREVRAYSGKNGPGASLEIEADSYGGVAFLDSKGERSNSQPGRYSESTGSDVPF